MLITLALIRARQEAPEQEPEASKQEPKPEPKTARVPVRQPPKLKVIERNPLPETLVKTLTSLLEKMPRQKVAIDDLYRAYAAQTQSDDRLPPVQFAELAGQFCRIFDIRISEIGGKAYLMGMRLVASVQQVAVK